MAELNIVEKVIALEGVELMRNLTPEQLARIASIARVVKHPAGHVVLKPDAPPEALYVIIDGTVELSQNGEVIHVAKTNDVLGAWALFDREPMPVTAKTLEHVRLLSISRDDFYDLLADNSEITAGIFATLVQRFRKLVGQT
jgi:CRP-like cAMP-binding protein